MLRGSTPPDFIIAGSAKSGTTALYAMLDQHPDIYMSDIKETNYFIQAYEPTRHLVKHCGQLWLTDYTENSIIDSLHKYDKLFDSASENQILGEASPWYLINNDVPQRIKGHKAETKIIIILRNPSDVAYANFAHQVRGRSESVGLSNVDALFESEHYANEALHPFAFHLQIPKYSKHLLPYLATFDKERLYFIIYEEFLKNRAATLTKLIEYLGVANYNDFNIEKRVNVSGMYKSKRIQNLMQISGTTKRILGLFVSKKRMRTIRSYIEAANTKPNPPMEVGTRKRLDDLYKEDLEFVERMLGREIREWRELRY